jgi:superfamily II DNA/RNA helicase
MIVGGSSIEDQFAKLAANPDIIIATPGTRFFFCFFFFAILS